MSRNLSSLSKRLSKLEQKMSNHTRQDEMANCVCRDLTFANPLHPEEFEAEMNWECPVYGFRDLGKIFKIRFVRADNTRSDEALKLDQIVDEYRTRLSQRAPRSIGYEDHSEEL